STCRARPAGWRRRQAAARWLTDEMREALAHRDWVRDAIFAAVETLESLQPPLAWLHTDLACSNLFVEQDGVRFIDFGAPAIGPAPLALYTFLHHLPSYVPRERLVAEAWPAQLKTQYARVWSSRGWDGAQDTFRAAKVMTYAMRTARFVEHAVDSHA